MKKLEKYIITLAIGLAIAFLIAVSKDIFNQESKKDIFHILSDAFFVPGIIITGVGLLVVVSNEGAFDGVAFAMIKFANLFTGKNDKKYLEICQCRRFPDADIIDWITDLACGIFLYHSAYTRADHRLLGFLRHCPVSGKEKLKNRFLGKFCKSTAEKLQCAAQHVILSADC